MSLRVENLKVYYRTLAGDVKALDGATFGLADGEIMGIAGESGCGKSTLGKSLIRLDGRMRYVEGSVELDGRELPIWDTQRMNPFRFKEISIVPQYAMSAMNPTRKIGKMIAELLRSRDEKFERVLPELERRLDLVGLSRDVLTMFPIELSGGMKQRMVMVISTLLNPSLLIADEVTSALDVSSQKAVAEMLVEFRERKFVKSTIVITHDLSVLYQIADTILVMYAGKLAEKASSETIIHTPLHPYTQLLISSLPEVGVRYEEKKLVGIPGRPPGLLNPPSGCRFRDRCPFAFEKCREEPPFVEIEPGHSVACWKVTAERAAAPSTGGQGESAQTGTVPTGTIPAVGGKQ
jgi:peptide/nickel transport system ATP-binding protein